jgi:hypothetical protein
MLRNTIIVPLRLPRNYEPAALPKQPIDQELRIGVLPPQFDRQRSATWTTPVSWIGEIDLHTRIPQEQVFEVDRIIVNAVEPVTGALPRIFRRLFPRSTILQTPECSTCDLVFIVSTESRETANYRDVLDGIGVTISITAVGRGGVTVASFSGDGIGRHAKGLCWSKHGEARGMGTPALRDAMEQLFAKLVNDPLLDAFIDERFAARTRPSDLETTVSFDDAASFFPNGRLDAGEQARLRFSVRNQGAGSAFAVRLRLSLAANAVTLQENADVGDIPPGATRGIDVPLSAGIEVDTAEQVLRVETLEKRDYGGRPVVVQLATERLRRPTLAIADVRLEDRGSRTRGDGDGQASNGEMLEAVILVRNSGPGHAAGAELTISSTSDVEVVEPLLKVGAISVNALKEVRALFRIPITFKSSDLGMTFRVVETRGASVAIAEKVQRWSLQMKKPQVEIGFRLFDGNSPQSRGNRDGVANNNETLELVLIPSNQGRLTASDVRLNLVSSVVGLTFKPAVIEVGELPPHAEGAAYRVLLTVPRVLGGASLLQRLPLSVTIAQADFPIGEQLISLPFHQQQPDLVAAVVSQSPLMEGKSVLFTLDIRNQGPLAAEDVKADVSSDNPAVELIDAAGAPAKTVRMDIGSISPETAVGKLQFRAHVRRNVDAVGAMVKVFVSQRDFAAVAAQTALTILKEEAARISAIPPALTDVVVPRAGVPATISFQRYRDGSRLSDEAVSLVFEVQSQTPLEAVRLEHNHRRIELASSAPIRSGETDLWQYEPRVRLDYGANEFEVVVITSEGMSNSRSMTLYRDKTRGRIWLAVIGVSMYREESLGDLEFAREDAVAVHSFYRQLGVPSEQVIQLLDEQATLANIKRSLGTELVRNASNPDDMVLIYFAGHGEREVDRSSADSDGYSKYLLPHDANRGDLFGSALSMEELSRILQRLGAERVVLIIDSCFSGAAGGRTPYEPNASSRGVTSSEFLSRMADAGKGRVILTASGSHEVARESGDTRHGIFTYFLLEGLRGAADTDHDGRIDVDEIYKFVSRKVSTATGGRQNPMRKSPNLTGTVVLGGRLQ